MQIIRTRSYTVRPLTEDHLSIPSYQPENLIDMLIDVMQVANDAKLAHSLQLDPVIISKLRKRRVSLSYPVMVRIHDVTGLEISNIRDLAGIPRPVIE